MGLPVWISLGPDGGLLAGYSGRPLARTTQNALWLSKLAGRAAPNSPPAIQKPRSEKRHFAERSASGGEAMKKKPPKCPLCGGPKVMTPFGGWVCLDAHKQQRKRLLNSAKHRVSGGAPTLGRRRK
jgi:hypothetical protein